MEKTASSSDEGKTSTGEHPTIDDLRKGVPLWKWKLCLVAVGFITASNGYDVSNTANIQPRIYDAFHDIHLLPWVGLAYIMAIAATACYAGRVCALMEMKWAIISHILIHIVGLVVSGSAQSMQSFIVGRVIQGWTGSTIQLAQQVFFTRFAYPHEMPKIFGFLGAAWAVGLAVGGPIGAAFAQNTEATWRWSMYFPAILLGVFAAVQVVVLPKYDPAPGVSAWIRLKRADVLGLLLNVAWVVLFAISLTFPGPVWSWDSGENIAVWVVFGCSFVLWLVQQSLCIFTSPDHRSFPIHQLPRRDLLPVWLASAGSGATYGLILYYTPLFFAFIKGHGPLGQTVRMLPYILSFLIIIIVTSGLLRRTGRYNMIYIVGGIIIFAGSLTLSLTLNLTTSESQVMGLTALTGVGLGLTFNHGGGICSVIDKNNAKAQSEDLIIFNIFMTGGIAFGLAIAGSVFQNVGFTLLTDALRTYNFSDTDIRQALAGVDSIILSTANPDILQAVLGALIDTIKRDYYIVVASGIVTLVAGLLCGWKRLDFN